MVARESPAHPLAALRERLGVRYSAHTVSAFLSTGRQFLGVAGVKPSYSARDVLDYVDALVRAGYRSASITAKLVAVRALLAAVGQPWPLAPRDLHLGLPEVAPVAPVLGLAEIGHLIAAAPRLPAADRAALALATLYGLRAAELGAVLAAGHRGPVLTVQTAKGGRQRIHQLPPGLESVLTFPPEPASRSALYAQFRRLMTAHARAPVPQEGWHAIRRALVTGLFEAGVPPQAIHAFMGWRSTKDLETFGISATSLRYYRPDPARVDAEVYARHPFLPLWHCALDGA